MLCARAGATQAPSSAECSVELETQETFPLGSCCAESQKTASTSAGKSTRSFFGVNNEHALYARESDTVRTDEAADIAYEALHFSVDTRALRSAISGREEQRISQGDANEAEQRPGEERRLQKVVDKKEFDGEAVLPLADFLDIVQTEALPPPVRVDLSVKGRVTGRHSGCAFSTVVGGRSGSSCCSPCLPPCGEAPQLGHSADSRRGGEELYTREPGPFRQSSLPTSPPHSLSPAVPETFSFSAPRPVALEPEKELRDVFLVEGVLSPKQCEWLWTRVEKEPGFTYWDSTHTAAETYRSAYTVEMFHPVLADVLWERVKDFVVREVTIDEADEERAERDLLGDWVACGVNPRLLFARYTDGAHFGPHTDGCTAVDFNTRTLWPAVLYLNDVEDGGETLVIADAQKTNPMIRDDRGRHTADPRWVVDAVEARAGRMLFFYHTQMHEGRRVGPGSAKYIIRTDIFYRRKTPMLTSPEDREAFVLWQRAQLLAEEGSTDDAAVLFRRSVKLSPGLAAVYGMA